MTVLAVKVTLAALLLLLSIAVPFGAFAAGEKTKGRYKTAIGANVFLFIGNHRSWQQASCLHRSCLCGRGDRQGCEQRGRHGAIWRQHFPPV